MSFFDDIISGVGELLGGGGGDAASSAGSSVIGAIAPIARIATPIVGSFVTSSANQRAAKAAADASQRQTDAILKGQADANARLDAIYEESAPARGRLLRMSAADPSMLTPEQKLQREDVLRGATTRLAASGLRGAGRAGVAAINEADRRFTAGALSSNANRGDAAARTLAGEGLSAAGRSATIDYGTGSRLAGVYADQGDTNAGLEIAQGKNVASTMGAISSAIASEAKADQRRRRYGSAGGVNQSEGSKV